MFVFCLLLLGLPPVFYQLKVQGWIIQLLAASHVSHSLAYRGDFYCNLEGETPGSLLGGAVQSSGKSVGVFLCPCATCLGLSQIIFNNV